MIDDFAKLAVDDFLNQLADRTPTPGGGGATALAGATACALARMVASYSIKKDMDPDVRKRVESVAVLLGRADEILRALITKDAEAYKAMTRAARVAGEETGANAAYQEAALSAAMVPMEMAAFASNALAAMNELKESANRFLLSDLGAAAVLASAVAEASRYTFGINELELSDESLRSRLRREMEALLLKCGGHRKSIEAFVQRKLERKAGNGR